MTTIVPTGTRGTPKGGTEAHQRGELRLAFEKRGEKTALRRRYFTEPFGPSWAIYPDATGIAEVLIVAPAGGIVGGDRYEIDVTLGPGSSATILTPGATRAYGGPEAGQRAVLRVGEGAFLEYLPRHVIPYARSSYRQESTFRLSEDATLLACDAFSAGRLARGERFGFDRLRAKTRIDRDGVAQLVEGFDLPGGGEPFGGYPYLATVYASAPEDLGPLAEELHGLLVGLPGVLASASAPAPNLCVARVLAQSAPALYRALNGARATARNFLGSPPSPRGLG